MVYYYELCDSLTNPYLLLMTCKSAQTYDKLLMELQTSMRITYQTPYVIQVGGSLFSFDSIKALFQCKENNVPIYYVYHATSVESGCGDCSVLTPPLLPICTPRET